MKNTSAEIKVDGKAYRIEARSDSASRFLSARLGKRKPATLLANCKQRASEKGDMVVFIIAVRKN